ncbi:MULTISPECIES: LysR family transcriptional regulator [Bacillaceae]|uniref:LysR family transcriptional regulator n=2 Tax=Bacteria TaxID=2 RepID=UPI001E582E60|nr:MULTISPECIES: LysR family transcriptional regulator [Bacillaceae]MCE4047979.1 LysR family transcriptional regulator [Bacillus sp. Au-Bac7]MCM3032509.1 LysR family transcriptional regulator [Niallia sp. MER 6]MDL0436416.1 LysR family transcriptional regulator [Niallia sp. SS-2023]UPO89186.1 LysR family transcriptional regulator [Niallia sp. Man26]
METRQIQYFLEVAKREHVTEAADALHIAQSSVSRQIFNLEEELGIELFIREGRRVKLTPLGKIFFERMKQVWNMMEDAKREVKEYLDPEKGTVRIAFPISMAAHTLPSIIYAFRTRYPEAKFQMSNALYYDLIDGVIKGDFNLAMMAPMPNQEKEPKIKGATLFTENIVALVPNHHPLANRASIRLRDLKDEPFCVLPEGFVFREQVVQACKDAHFSPSIAFEGKDIDALKGLVSAGLGVALMPEMTLVDNTPRSTVIIPIADSNLTRTVGVIYPTQRKLLPTEELFYDFLLETYERLNEFKQ